ncbi:GNAT family N-acetyltransferase [Nakamurella aerolata]|uniref:GNAT family N-acetyltransferase n=1 Tax=Nakamurella aerolata TaxID=1656892 RepID=A0A849ACU4_9ACTN|nr:GNAT family N-acetyltransferase [Nakamurella aerolata]NNG37011.1 GNAT family N-acetyltransferase [Nakamurella aerolata]
MSALSLAVLPVTDDPAFAPLFDAFAAIEQANHLDLLGHTDLVDSAAARRVRYSERKNHRGVLVLAVDGPVQAGSGRFTVDGVAGEVVPVLDAPPDAEVVGFANVGLSVHDNLHLSELDVAVPPAHRGRGIGSELYRAAERIAAAEGRGTLVGYTGHRQTGPVTGPDALAAPTGVGALSRTDPFAAFMLRQGFSLEQTERHSELALPVPPEVLSRLQSEAGARSAGYRMVQWVGPTPEEYLDRMAVLHNRMSVDVPSGDLDLEEEAWDAERIRNADATTVKMGRFALTTAAQHEQTGELVAYTVIGGRQDTSAVWQDDTLVHGDHRGHRLGLAVKLANLARLLAERPDTERIHTSNAGENRWMLAINEAMGFRPASTEGAWQKKLDQTAQAQPASS